jgi:hypothetical protein
MKVSLTAREIELILHWKGDFFSLTRKGFRENCTTPWPRLNLWN